MGVGKPGLADRFLYSFRDLCDILEDVLHLPLARGSEKGPKLVLSHDHLERIAERAANEIGLRIVKSFSVLGVDSSAGRRAYAGKFTSRCRAVLSRVPKVKRVGRGVNNAFLLGAGLTPAIMYSVPVHGMSGDRVHRIRRAWVSALRGWRQGNSTTLTLRFCGWSYLDPLFQASCLPILAFLKYMHNGDELIHNMIFKTWGVELRRLSEGGYAWKLVRGPIGALI